MLVGDATAWLAGFDSIEAKLSRAVEQAWPGCLSFLDPRIDPAVAREDPITRALIFALRRTKTFPGRIISQYDLLVLGGAGVAAPSKIDFVITIGDDDDVYLACESKRLNVQRAGGRSTGASAYVSDGLARFAEGRYATGLPVGVMLGYVMDGQADAALNAVLNRISAAQAILRMNAGSAPIPSALWRRFATTHQCSSGSLIEVRHTLLPVV